jgi:hypothetical protein
VVLVVLVAAERATASPMIDVSLFHNPRFTAASGAVAIAVFALLGFHLLDHPVLPGRALLQPVFPPGCGCCPWPRRWPWRR